MAAPSPRHRNNHLKVDDHPGRQLLRSHASSASLRSRDKDGNSVPPTPVIVNMLSHVPSPLSIDASTSGGSSASGSSVTGNNVRVVVRVRGFLPREYERDAVNLIEMDPQTQETHLLPPPPSAQKAGRAKVLDRKTFIFDNSFWSIDRDSPHYADQVDVYDALGQEFLDHNFQGYHTCIFAYGQTGAGKSYSMMGTPENPGLIPRTCHDLFERIQSNDNPNVTYTVRVSYFEVYNEQVRDLLDARRGSAVNYLRVRESPADGPYIKDLIEVPVRNIKEVLGWMKRGDQSRTVASTNMNDTSSRSHAVFTLILKQIECTEDDETIERLARIRLVDLAGSERANSTGATGARLREGSNINKSLTTLGRVIAALSDEGARRHKRKDVVPYRDSILTWLLKDSLGGNSKTAMIACISPTDYDETLSTLRYADQAKRIRTSATVNEDQVSRAARDAQIIEMQNTIRRLQMSVSEATMTQKHNESQSTQMEMYQQQVFNLQRVMEDAREAADCKINQLQSQNEALRTHLRLALETIKHPIPAIPVHSDDEGEDEESEEDEVDEFEEEQLAMEAEMSSILHDVTAFQRKLQEDKEAASKAIAAC